jgi:hypothetical protein
MSAIIPKTILSLCLALRNPQVTLNSQEKLELTEVGERLEKCPDRLLEEERFLMTIITGNSTLNQAYQVAKQQLETISDEHLLELLPTLDELERELTNDFNTEKRGRKPGEPRSNHNTEIVVDIAVPIFINTDNASKISFLERLWQEISGSSFQDPNKDSQQ